MVVRETRTAAWQTALAESESCRTTALRSGPLRSAVGIPGIGVRSSVPAEWLLAGVPVAFAGERYPILPSANPTHPGARLVKRGEPAISRGN